MNQRKAGKSAAFKGIPFEDEYQYLLDFWTLQGYTLPSSDNQVYQNQLIKNLKGLEDGISGSSNLLSRISYMLINNEYANLFLVDWASCIASAGASATEAIAVNSPTFTSNEGFQGNGTSSYINLNASLYISPTAGYYYYLRNNARSGVHGHMAGSNYAFWAAANPSIPVFPIVSTSGAIRFPSGTETTGRFLANCETTTTMYAWRNQVVGATFSCVNGGVTRQPMLLARKISQDPSPLSIASYSTAQCSSNIVFNDLSNAEAFQLDDAFQLYMTQLGKAI